MKPILSNPAIFGLNLYDIWLGSKIEDYFKEMIAGKDAVKKLLRKVVGC